MDMAASAEVRTCALVFFFTFMFFSFFLFFLIFLILKSTFFGSGWYRVGSWPNKGCRRSWQSSHGVIRGLRKKINKKGRKKSNRKESKRKEERKRKIINKMKKGEKPKIM